MQFKDVLILNDCDYGNFLHNWLADLSLPFPKFKLSNSFFHVLSGLAILNLFMECYSFETFWRIKTNNTLEISEFFELFDVYNKKNDFFWKNFSFLPDLSE